VGGGHGTVARVTTPTTERVRDVMVSRPKTLPAAATVGEVRRLFGNVRIMAALLVDGDAFAGVLSRDDLPAGARDDEPARPYARRDVERIDPDAPVSDARAWLDANDARRLVVIDADGSTLRGLLCLTRDRTGFCSD
jgi:CBS domain-containing protein